MLDRGEDYEQGLAALRPFCKSGNATDYTRLDALLYSEYGDRPIGELPKLYGFDTEAKIQALSAHVFHQLYQSWDKLVESMCRDYNPLENYSMTEHGEDTKKARGKGASTTNTKGYSVTDDVKDEYDFDAEVAAGVEDYKVTNTNVGGTTTDKVTTYDSSTYRNLQQSETTPSPVTSTMTESGQHGAKSDTASKELHEHDFSRSGNIGVMTATDMLKNDSEFWSTNDFFSIIASNIASLVTNPYYE